MLSQKNRLRQRSDFGRMRREGKKVSHPLAVLVFCPSDHPHSRFAFRAGRHIGGAVVRNRAKRRLREAVRSRLPAIKPGWDCMFVVRDRLPGATFEQIDAAVEQLLTRAALFAGKST